MRLAHWLVHRWSKPHKARIDRERSCSRCGATDLQPLGFGKWHINGAVFMPDGEDRGWCWRFAPEWMRTPRG